TTVQPPGLEGPKYELELQGLSESGQESIFVAMGKLTEDAPIPPPGFPELYMRKEGEAGLRYVCVLPGGAAAGACTVVGLVFTQTARDRLVRVNNAISADGTKVFWSSANNSIYVRENPFGVGGECSGAGTPCTLEVAPPKSQYWGAARDGSKAIFTNGGKLF